MDSKQIEILKQEQKLIRKLIANEKFSEAFKSLRKAASKTSHSLYDEVLDEENKFKPFIPSQNEQPYEEYLDSYEKSIASLLQLTDRVFSKLERHAQGQNLLSRINCNRTESRNAFQIEAVKAKTTHFIQHYISLGSGDANAINLAHRLILELADDGCDIRINSTDMKKMIQEIGSAQLLSTIKDYQFVDKNEPKERIYKALIKRVKEQLKHLLGNTINPQSNTLQTILTNDIISESKYIPVNMVLVLSTPETLNKYIPVLKWFVNDFCKWQGEALPFKLLFFINFEIGDLVPPLSRRFPMNLLKFDKLKQQTKILTHLSRQLEALKTIKNVTVLPPISPAKLKDLEIWFREFGFAATQAKEKAIELIGQNERKKEWWEMASVEQKINEYFDK